MKKLFPLFLCFVFGACKLQPDADDLINDMVVLTNYDESAGFDTFTTYTMPLDSIGLVTNNGELEWLADDYGASIASAVKNNLSSTGRMRVDTSDAPQLALNVYVVQDIRIYQSLLYPYYPGYGGYYGYTGYYNYPQVVYRSQATVILVIEMVDLVNIDPDSNEARVLWTVNIGDLAQSFDPDHKVIEAIDQAFAQSQYLQR